MQPSTSAGLVSPTLGRFLNHFATMKRSGNGYMVNCSAHDDQHASLKASDGDGGVLLHCKAGCAPEAIVTAVGMTMAELFYDYEPQHVNGALPSTMTGATRPTFNADAQKRIEKERDRADAWNNQVDLYEYTDMETGRVAEKGRFEATEVGPNGKRHKEFPWRWQGEERWSGGVKLAALALWGYETVIAAPEGTTVYFCEGEKAVRACRAKGLVAVTHAGGASTKDFGASLEVLRGRKVALWPDNDAAGRDYMAVVEARLRGVARSIQVVDVTVPPAGDAVEFFGEGGTVALLESGQRPLDGPAVDYLTHDGVRIIIPYAAGKITFSFNEMEKTARALDCELSIEVHAPGFTAEPYIERINILSNSARNDLKRDLDVIYGKGKIEWVRLLNTAFGRARTEFMNLDRSVDLFDIEDATDELFFLEPFVPNGAMTIMFGDGSSLKSYLCFDMAFCVAYGLPYMGSLAPQVPVLVVDWEDEEHNFRRRLRRIAAGHGFELEPHMIRYIPARGLPLRDLVQSIRQIVREWGIGLLIIDSLGPACGGKPEDSDVALAYARTVQKIGITSIHIAHITKDDVKKGNTDKPFGSIFWHNEARRTWFIAREQEEESDDLDIGMFCKKANDGPRPRPFSAHVHFDGKHGPITMNAQDVSAIPELQSRREPKRQIIDHLLHFPGRTIKEIMDDTGLTKNQVEVVLRNRNIFVVTGLRPALQKGGRPSQEFGLLTYEE